MNPSSNVPDSTAVRVALWRALHLEVDAPPHIFEDHIGLRLVRPEAQWRMRGDMHPQGTAPFRASIVARARFVEDLVQEEFQKGVNQYVILGAGLDSFAQRHPELASQLKIFEIDKPETQAWKRDRLLEEGFSISSNLSFVPVNFDSGESWWGQLIRAGFDVKRPAVVTSIGVSMYLSFDAIKETLAQMKSLALGSKFLMTFLLPIEQVDPKDQPGFQMSIRGAQASGTPFLSFFSPKEMMALAQEVGFSEVKHLSTSDLTPKYFSHRTDGLRPSTGEEILILSP